MPVFIGKPHNFIFDGRTVSGSGSFDLSRIQRRAVQTGTDDIVRFLIRIGQPAGSLRNLYSLRFCCKRKRNHSLISKLFLHLAVIDRPPVNSCRCSCFEPIHLNPQALQRISQMIGSLQAVRTCMHADISIDTSCFQVSSGTENHCFCMIDCSGIQTHSRRLAVPDQNLCHFCLYNLKMFCLLQHHTHGTAVFCLIRLGAQRMYCRSL